MADTPNAAPEIHGALPLYKKPVPLNAEAHKNLGIRYVERPFEFLAQTHFVPLTIGEFGNACGHYPVIFVGEKSIPVAAMGLKEKQNLFVDPETGKFEPNSYVPAYVRRYPFVAATHGDGSEQFTICIDEGSDLVSDKPEEPFFTEGGEPSSFTQNAIEFVRRFEFDIRNTEKFVEELKSLDLLEEQDIKFQPRDEAGNPVGDEQIIAKFVGISTKKFQSLDPNKLAELRDNTLLGAIYAAMLSQRNWDGLLRRSAIRNTRGKVGQPQPGAVNVPPPPSEM